MTREAAPVVDLGLNYPVASPAPDLAAGLRALAAEVEAGSAGDLLGYRDPQGALADREAGAIALGMHGVRASVDHVALSAGAQHGLSVSLATTCRPGDTVAAECLSYPGFAAAAQARGLRVLPVEMDRDGVVPESFEEVCERGRPRALYLAPTLQNPTTSTLSLERREQIAEIADKRDVWIIEDDVHRLLAPDAPPPIAALAPQRSIYIASLAKCLAPALRIAYLHVPAALYERVVDQVWGSVWTASPLTAAIASRWVRDGSLERVARGRRAEAVARQELAADVFRGLPAGFRSVAASTAYHLWLELGESWNATSFANATRDRGVLVTPADAFHVGPGAAPAAVRVSLSGAPDRATLDRALQVLLAVAEHPEGARVRL